MFGHLDDPSPPAPDARALKQTLARAARLRRRRTASVAGTVAAATLLAGVALGLLVPHAGSAEAFAAFTSHEGVLASETLVPQSHLADVVFVGQHDGFAIALHGDQTALASSNDAGATWRVVDGSLPVRFPAQIEFADAAHGYLWGGAPSSSGTLPLWMSADGGRSWKQVPIGPVVSDVSAIGADVWAVTGTCPITSSAVPRLCPVEVEVSLDHGLTWQPTDNQPSLSENSALAISDEEVELARITPTHAYVLSFASTAATPASSAQLLYTADGGRTWQPRVDPCPPEFAFGEQIAASGTNDLWLACSSQASAGSQAKALYRSADGGATWRLTAAANAPVLAGNNTLPATGGLPVGGYLSPYSLGHDNLAVVTPSSAWLFPDGSGVFETSDGGRTWRLAAGLWRAGLVPGGSGNVVFVDATHGWACEVGTGLWRTTDGVSWERPAR